MASRVPDPRRANPLGRFKRILVVALIIVTVGFYVWQRLNTNRRANPRRDRNRSESRSDHKTSEGEAKSSAPLGPIAPGLPDVAVKPTPVAEEFEDCPPEGDGGDPALNRLKNRIDEPGQYYPVALAAIEELPWPDGITRRGRSRWTDDESRQVSRYEGIPVAVEGYLADAKLMDPESPNCHGADREYRDFHIWLTEGAGEDRTRSIVVETTPRVRSKHPEWTIAALKKIAREKQRVRISGWLLLDPEHPDQIGKTRGTIWEIHPITKIEVQSGGTWRPIDIPA